MVKERHVGQKIRQLRESLSMSIEELSGKCQLSVSELEHLENGKGEAIEVAPGNGHTVWLPVPEEVELEFALLMRNFNGESTRNPHSK